MHPDMNAAEKSRWFLECLVTGLLYYYVTSLVPVLGVVFGHQFLVPQLQPMANERDLLSCFATWDGYWYVRIATTGYSYDPDQASDVAFFPAYPLLGRTVILLTGCRAELALLLVSHLFLAASFVLTAAYVRQRWAGAPPQLAEDVLLSLGLLPTTCFFRMTYTETLFLFFTVLTLWALVRGWPLPVTALVIGAATAIRPVGVALLVPWVLHLWQHSSGWPVFVRRASLWIPLACWGIAGYALYQYTAFGDPLAFANTQTHWRVRPPVDAGAKAMALLTLEPLWSIYDPGSPAYWEHQDKEHRPLFSLTLLNPVYFVLAVALVAYGAYRRWLSGSEVALAASLLLIPYVTKSHEMGMNSMGRFVAAVLPVHLVIGQLLCRGPRGLVVAYAVVCSFFLGVYSALFACWGRIF